MKTPILPKCLVAGSLALLAAGCSDSDDGQQPPNVSVVVANNVADSEGTVDVFAPNLNSRSGSFTSGSNEGIAFDSTGTLFQAGDNATFTGLRVFANFASRADGSAYTAGFDRQLDGAGGLTGGFAGKGIVVIDAIGRVVVADNAAGDIKLFSTTAGDGAVELAAITTAAAPWDVTYDAESDRLYAALVDGTVAIFDEFASDPTAGPDRSIFPIDGEGTQLSVNFHGLAKVGSQLVVTDVGDASAADDGQIFTLTDDGSVDGGITADARIVGSRTRLGNPVDLVLTGRTAIVAEKANDLVLTFNDVTSANGNVSPSYVRGQTKPESVALLMRSENLPADSSDINASDSVTAVVVSTNPTPPESPFPGGTGDTGQILLLETDLSAEIGALDASAGGMLGTPARQLESIAVDTRGHAYVTYDNGSAGADNTGVLVANRVGARAGTAADVPSTDRLVAGATSELNAPKGIELVQSLGLMLVADNGTPAISAYGLEADGDSAPVFTVTDVGSASIWDLDYDPANDRLFVAATDGAVLVYDDFAASARGDAGAMVSRTILPASGGAQISVNLHGIVHVAESDQLILTDVGDAASAEDGQIFVIDNASSASGNVNVTVQILGDQTQLGNPVDVAFDGAAIFVAEKSNDVVLRYDDILSLSGTLNVAADAQIAVTKPESVSLTR